jgi:hypothetical protein
MLVSCLAYFSTLKIDAICFYKTKVNFHHIVRRYIPEDGALPSRLCENFKPTIFIFVVSILQGYSKWFIHFQNAIYLKTNESFIVTLYINLLNIVSYFTVLLLALVNELG